MIGQRSRWHPLGRRRPSELSTGQTCGPTEIAADRPPRVEVAACDPATAERLAALARGAGDFEVVGTSDGDDAVAADVVVVTLADGDPSGLGRLRRAARSYPRPRTVVVARGTDWFDVAFGAGADVWVDTDADDETLLAAVVAPLGTAAGSSLRRGPDPAWPGPPGAAR